VTRRRFLRQTAAGAAAPYVISSGVLAADARRGPNDKINVALIGAGSQGNWNLTRLLQQPDCVVVGVCDVWSERREVALAKCNGTARGYHDFREVLAQKDIDAVLIATPPHWHALMAIGACEAVKDFYLEKPMTLYPAETLAVMRAVRKHNRITQIGTQIHATEHYHRMVDLLRSGVLGKISVCRTFHVMNQGPEGIGDPPVGDPPAGLDVDFWCGPAPRKYHPLLMKDASHHTSFMAWSGGWTPGMAPHVVDLPYWALELGHPTRVSSTGGRYVIKDCGDAYDSHEVLWTYPNFTMTWTTSLVNSYGFDMQGKPGLKRRVGIYFQGVNGTLVTDYSEHKIIPEGDRMKPNPEVPKLVPDSPGHHREWLDGIRSRKQPSCHVGYHYKVDMAITLSLLSLKLGRSISFNPEKETIVGDHEARKLAVPVYRKPWKFPKEYLA